jgi:dipeptide/tripeptide permease
MLAEMRPAPSRQPLATFLICCGVGLVGFLLPVLLGHLIDQDSPRAGRGLSGLFAFMGAYVGLCTGPVAFGLSLLVVFLSRALAPRQSE